MGAKPSLSDPFFAYGTFRKGETAFPCIASYVASVTEGAVEGMLEERDGVHLLVLGVRRKVSGDLIEFKQDARDAYAAINALEPFHTYRWEECAVDTGPKVVRANVLVARSPGRGSHPVHEPYRRRVGQPIRLGQAGADGSCVSDLGRDSLAPAAANAAVLGGERQLTSVD